MNSPLPLVFNPDHTALAVTVNPDTDLTAALVALALPVPLPVLVVVGGASGLDRPHMERLRSWFQTCICPWLTAHAMGAIDGGTQAGVMQLLGEARQATQSQFPLLGIAARGTVHLPQPPDTPEPESKDDDRANLEPHHPTFLLVPGDNWGDEVPWIARVAQVWAAECPSLTLLINGGAIAFEDVAASVAVGRPVVVVEGSGRTADQLAAALGGDRSHPQANALVDSGLVHRLSLDQEITQIQATLSHLLSAGRRA